MAKEYGLYFGSTTLSATSGLAPTFIHFIRMDTGGTLTPPGITQVVAGVGAYKFSYTPSFPIYFQVDGATTGLGANRFITGTLGNVDQIDDIVAQTGATMQAIGATILQGQVNLGSTLVAIGNTSITGIAGLITSVGSTASLIGTDVVNPGTLYGYLKRAQEIGEGDSTYVKASGVLTMTDRTGATTLAVKTLADSGSEVTKT